MENGNKRQQKLQGAGIEVNICCSKLLGLSEQQFPGYRRTMSCSLRYKCWRKRPFLASREMLCLRGIPSLSHPWHCSGRFFTLGVVLHSHPEPFLPLISCFSIFRTQERASLKIKPEKVLVFQRHSLKKNYFQENFPIISQFASEISHF